MLSMKHLTYSMFHAREKHFFQIKDLPEFFIDGYYLRVTVTDADFDSQCQM